MAVAGDWVGRFWHCFSVDSYPGRARTADAAYALPAGGHAFPGAARADGWALCPACRTFHDDDERFRTELGVARARRRRVARVHRAAVPAQRSRCSGKRDRRRPYRVRRLSCAWSSQTERHEADWSRARLDRGASKNGVFSENSPNPGPTTNGITRAWAILLSCS